MRIRPREGFHLGNKEMLQLEESKGQKGWQLPITGSIKGIMLQYHKVFSVVLPWGNLSPRVAVGKSFILRTYKRF